MRRSSYTSCNFEVLGATVVRLHALPLSHHAGEGVGAVTRLERSIGGVLALIVLAFAPLPALLGARASREQMQRERELGSPS